MATQSELIDQIKDRLFILSDYALSQRWQIEPTRINQYRRNRLRLPIRFIEDISEQIGIDALTIIKMLDTAQLTKQNKDASKIVLWRPNEKIRRYPPPWVERKHWIRKKR